MININFYYITVSYGWCHCNYNKTEKLTLKLNNTLILDINLTLMLTKTYYTMMST